MSKSGDEAWRLFVAIPLPDDVTRQLAQHQDTLRTLLPPPGWDIRFARAETMHLTLKFLGQVASERASAVEDALTQLRERSSFTCEVTELGAFPGRSRPQVLWAGIENGANELEAIAAEVNDRLEPVGFARENRPFRPHITLGRVKRAARNARSVLDPLRAVTPCRFDVAEVRLYRSHLRRGGAEHEILARFALKSP